MHASCFSALIGEPVPWGILELHLILPIQFVREIVCFESDRFYIPEKGHESRSEYRVTCPSRRLENFFIITRIFIVQTDVSPSDPVFPAVRRLRRRPRQYQSPQPRVFIVT